MTTTAATDADEPGNPTATGTGGATGTARSVGFSAAGAPHTVFPAALVEHADADADADADPDADADADADAIGADVRERTA
ncbi:hypothetical protein ACF09K_15225 [Streptomyces sp. NPDC014882]|uniref:hypothetical protein n=1 Tax=Streptomyces sp. NPDC014882 TaxID=3364927 RepID=UPI0036FA3110